MHTPRRLLVVGLVASASAAHAGELRKSSNPIAGQYIVVFDDSVMRTAGVSSIQAADDHARAYGVRRQHVYRAALNGYSTVGMTEEQARAIADDPRVKFVEQDSRVSINATQSNATWGLDRIDQRALPLSSTYTYNFDGSGVHAYIVDTGIRASHSQFTGRMGNGFSAIAGGTADCNGHGTHVAGTVGGTIHGVAKRVTLHAVRVLDCGGSGSNAGVIAGIDWVRTNHVKPAVANMSLGGGISAAVDTALNNAINAGVTFVVAAGNANANACNGSPSRVPAAITVGSSTSSDARSSFSNFGTCVDIFAPGSSITSAWSTGDTATSTISGTSMASPHVAGVVAVYLSQFGHTAPATVAAALNTASTTGRLTGIGTGSPNRLLHSLFGGVPPTPTPTPRVTPTPTPTGGPGGGEITPVAVTASSNDGNVPANTLDNNLGTRWSALGDGQWIRYDLGAVRAIGSVRIAFYRGNARRATFDLQVSNDGTTWTPVRTGLMSSGTTLAEEPFTLGANARYVRYLGHGNTENGWNSLTEVSILAP